MHKINRYAITYNREPSPLCDTKCFTQRTNVTELSTVIEHYYLLSVYVKQKRELLVLYLYFKIDYDWIDDYGFYK